MCILTVNKALPLPIHAQLTEQLRQQIEAGTLSRGTRLPTVRALAQELRINYNTVRAAYQELERQGYVLTKQGQGTFVATDSLCAMILDQHSLHQRVHQILATTPFSETLAHELLRLTQQQTRDAPLPLTPRHFHADEGDQCDVIQFLKSAIATLTLHAAALKSTGSASLATVILEITLWLAEECVYFMTNRDPSMEHFLFHLSETDSHRHWHTLPNVSIDSLAKRLNTVVEDKQESWANMKHHACALLPATDLLTEREVQVLHFVADGYSNQKIAQELIVSVGTVKWYLKTIYHKLDVHSRTEALARARMLHLLV